MNETDTQIDEMLPPIPVPSELAREYTRPFHELPDYAEWFAAIDVVKSNLADTLAEVAE